MNISSIQLNSYLASIAQSQTINTSTQESEVQSDKKNSDKDSYISTISSIDEAIPCGTYNAQGLEVGTGSNTTTTSQSQGGGAIGASSGGSGGESSDSEEDTETEVVTINGVTYLQTTTTDANGNTTITRTPIGSTTISDNQ
jgi:hypothetical protein